jgi:hypothetical protein
MYLILIVTYLYVHMCMDVVNTHIHTSILSKQGIEMDKQYNNNSIVYLSR